ncbi:hypothetical protein [Salinicola halimionae]|uniref:hypothetical protein n=1 Tax=Salinicola halimionae TaxID=1949081 RepID=UPI000DA1E798|nr:hypothetical protein [Salinicola halimionae]
MKMMEDPTALSIAPGSLLHKLKETTRVVLVASNPNITQKHIRQAAITSDCLIFSFNKCRQLYKLPLKANHCFVHRYGIRKQSFFGFPHKLRIRVFKKLARDTETFLLDGDVGSIEKGNIHFIPMTRNLSLLEDYPFDDLPDRGGASTGFYMIALLMDLKAALELDFTVSLIGFTEGGGGRQWYGHAWKFERQATARLNFETIPVYPKKQAR